MIMDVWTNNHLGYVPITKNASTSWVRVFADLGWQLTQLDLIDPVIPIFGHFRDPIERHFAGTAEFLCQNGIPQLVDDPVWQQVWIKGVMDMHSYPVTWAMGEHAQRCHWIPMHHRLDTDGLTRSYLATHHIHIDHVPRLNESEPFKRQLYYRLRALHDTLDAHNHLSWFYDSDIVLWNSLFPYVDTHNQWHTIY